jgi:hypothetical protein
MRVNRTGPLPPPPPQDYGLVPWDAPEPEPAKPPKRTRPAPQTAPDPPVTLAGVRLSGRTAGFVDAGYDLGRTVRDRPLVSAALVGSSIALAAASPTLALGVTVMLVGVGLRNAIMHERRAHRAQTPAEREHEHRSSGRFLFLAATSVPFRAVRLSVAHRFM